MKKIIILWLPLIVWMIVIYWFSSRASLPGSQIDWLDFVVKKVAHISEYAILTFLAFRAFRRPVPDYAILLSLFYAFTDESHQFFTPGRTSKLSDVFIDSIGITIMAYLISRYHGRVRHKNKSRN